MIKSVSLGAVSLLAAAVFAGPAFADGMPGRGRVKAPETRTGPCTVSANVGYTTDYVFRGISQTNEEAAVQGGVDLTCGKFYLGTWGSSIAFGNGTEIDIYGGYKTSSGPVSWDVGFIYYAYPGAPSFLDLDYVELKIGASAEIVKGGTVGATLFYSPEYTGNTGEVFTWELSYSQALPNVGMFSPTVSATYGYSDFQDLSFLSYAYWNIGVSLAFYDRWSLDLRYWDTDGEGAAFANPLADGRFVATLKYTF